MDLDELNPGNTKRGKDTAITAFETFIGLTTLSSTLNNKLQVNAGCLYWTSLVCISHLMRVEGQSKMWLFELFPVQRYIAEAKLLSIRKMLDGLYMKRGGKVVNKAPPCSKVYVASDCQDAASLCLLWCLFGRASDLSLVRRQNRSVDSGKIFFVCFIRMKPSKELGLSLFPDAEFVACPLHAITMAIITQIAPTVTLITNLSDVPVTTAVTLSPIMPLLEVLNYPEKFDALKPAAAPVRHSEAPVDTPSTI
ncbi:Hypothetical protein PHPALM_17346 [Phytophthora palmivora]|uniref:Uncharacterized protein n=1 Tax=Phytophthora palmivora TaxID=4796 RepID=A0A2P4XMF3_9STRA|nr:Hypothetical protein PHPALM_17346 [Phytophthora palmivora]